MKKLGIGYEFYKEFIDKDMYYVDKTFLIKDILEKGGKVTLFTRPRRFGKTLALSMLQTFFELEYDRDGNVVDKHRYFEGMKIMGAGSEILAKMGQYPIINLSLKSAKQPNFETAFKKLRDEIIGEFRRHAYLWQSEQLLAMEREELKALAVAAKDEELEDRKKFEAEVGRFSTALRTLSEKLAKHHGRNVIILLDEYDVPLENAYYSGFYNEMVDFVRSLFESALKTNNALEFAAVTGCLRISKESIFTGLNHLQINSIRDDSFNEAFGFTTEETNQMLLDYGMEDRVEEAKEWYDGYLFGDAEVYNPWSIVKYVSGVAVNGRLFPEPYWANTSSNAIIKDLVARADEKVREELDLLVNGGTIEKKIHEDITYDDIYESEDNLWNFLFFTGYMKKVSERKEGLDIYLTMKIPNQEICSIYDRQIRNWFDRIVDKTDRKILHQAVLDSDTDAMEDYVNELLEQCISTFDSAESFYHGFFLSLLYGVPRYSVKSNREEGIGRPDITLYPNRPKDFAILFEVKVRKAFNEMDGGIEEALRQIKEKKYEEGVLAEGYAGVVSYGVCFCKKSCIVRKSES